jgi:hypothetical protein
MEKATFIPSRQGNPMIMLGSNCFYKNCTRANGAIYWKCYYARKKNEDNNQWDCKASLTTTGLNLEFQDKNLNHVDHPPFTELDARIHQCLDTISKRARNEYGTVGSIFRDEINHLIEEDFDIDELAAKMPKFENRKDKIYEQRNKDIPKNPKSVDKIDLSSERFSNTLYKKRFLLFDTNDDDRIIAYASDIQLTILAKATRWHIDGTFKCCPDVYYQVFTIHALFNEHMYFTVIFFLIGESTLIYSKAIQWFKSACQNKGMI